MPWNIVKSLQASSMPSNGVESEQLGAQMIIPTCPMRFDLTQLALVQAVFLGTAATKLMTDGSRLHKVAKVALSPKVPAFSNIVPACCPNKAA
eukprot:5969589-Amphidinium_carterae.1